MFLDELSTFPSDIEIEFVTDLAPEMKPVSKAPHRMAPVKVKELAKWIQEMLEKEMIRPRVPHKVHRY